MITDFEKLLIIFIFSFIFTVLVLVFFHFWKKIRKDKLQIGQFSNDYIDEDIKVDIDPTFNKQAFIEISNLRKPKNICLNHKKSNLNFKTLLDQSNSNKFLGWLSFIKNMDDTDLFNIVNTEGFMYLYFLKSTGFVLFILSFFSILFLLPLFATGDNIKTSIIDNIQKEIEYNKTKSISNIEHQVYDTNHTIYNTAINLSINNKRVVVTDGGINNSVVIDDLIDEVTIDANIDFLQTLTIKNIYNSNPKILIVLIFSYFVTFLAFLHVYKYKQRLDLITSNEIFSDNIDTEVSLHTLHIRGINKNLSYKEAQRLLSDFINMTFQNYNIISVQVIPSYDKIIDLIDKRFQLESDLNKLERANHDKSYLSRIKISIGDNIVDAEIFKKEEIKITDKMLDFYRKLIARKNTGNAFISFQEKESIDEIIKTKEEMYSKQETLHGTLLNVKNWRISRAPTPSDIIWQNIKYSKKMRLVKMFVITCVLFYTCLTIVTPKVVSL